MNKKNIKKTALIDGPSKMDLMNALAYAYDHKHKFFVEFTTEDGEQFTVRIASIAHEGNSGSSFNILGYVEKRTGRPGVQNVYAVILPDTNEQHQLYYSTATRKGTIEIEPASYLPVVGDRQPRQHIGGRH